MMDAPVKQVTSEAETSLSAGIMGLPLKAARENFEREYMRYQWQHADGSVSKLAKNIGMERTHLYRKLKSLGIDHKK